MKVTTESVNPAFKPVRLEIILTTKAELDAFGSLFNSGSVANALREQGCEAQDIWRTLRDAGADINTPVAYKLTRIPD
jgi:hypothetical protein